MVIIGGFIYLLMNFRKIGIYRVKLIRVRVGKLLNKEGILGDFLVCFFDLGE